MADHISTDISHEMTESYSSYAFSVAMARALPDVRDGLKPVHRYILYAMHELRLNQQAARVKSAKIVGDAMGNYHPHGDTSIYDAMVRMAQPFSLRLPLIDGEGNFGSQDGDRAAAMRYTESRISHAGMELIQPSELDSVPFRENYDATRQEPRVLPAPFPNLIINGGEGIAVGIASRIPPHNPTEVMRAAIAMIERPDISPEDLRAIVPGPDFPTGGLLVGLSEENLWSNSDATYYIRSKYHIEEGTNHSRIILTEIPYKIPQHALVDSINSVTRDSEHNNIPGIIRTTDESDRNGLRIVIQISNEYPIDTILQGLWRYTLAQIPYHSNFTVFDGTTARDMTMHEALHAWIQWRRQIIHTTMTKNIRQLRKEAHIALGRWLASSRIQHVINELQESTSPQNARERLQSIAFDAQGENFIQYWAASTDKPLGPPPYYLTNTQADEILAMPLRRIARFAQEDAERAAAEAVGSINELSDAINHPENINRIMIQSLQEQSQKFSDARCTEVTSLPAQEYRAIQYTHTPRILTISKDGWCKGIPLSDIDTQHRGSRGKSLEFKTDDPIIYATIAYDDSYILTMTDNRRIYCHEGGQWPRQGVNGRGRPINILYPNDDEMGNIVTILELPKDALDDTVVLISTSGNILAMDGHTILTRQRRGKILYGDGFGTLHSAIHLKNDEDLFITTDNGRGVRINMEKIRVHQHTGGSGVHGLANNVNVLAAIAVGPNDQIIMANDNGHAMNTSVAQFKSSASRRRQGLYTGTRDGAPYMVRYNPANPTPICVISKEGRILKIDPTDIRNTHRRSANGVILLRHGHILSLHSCPDDITPTPTTSPT